MSGIERSNDELPTQESAPSMSSAAAVKTHVTFLVGLALCGVAFWFELGRALGGNTLSWAYVFEWPLLAVFAVYMWWKLLHPGFTLRRPRAPQSTIAPEYEGMLAAWQAEQQRLEDARRVEESPSPEGSATTDESSRRGE